MQSFIQNITRSFILELHHIKANDLEQKFDSESVNLLKRIEKCETEESGPQHVAACSYYLHEKLV